MSDATHQDAAAFCAGLVPFAERAPAPRQVTLYEHLAEFDALCEELEAAGDEPSKELLARVEEAALASKAKIDRCCQFLVSRELQIFAAGEEIERLRDFRRIAERDIERFKAYLIAVMRELNITRMDGNTARLRRQNNSVDTVVIAPGAEIPDEYMKVAVELPLLLWRQMRGTHGLPDRAGTPEPSKSTLKRALEAGVEIPGVRLERQQHLRRA